MEEALNRENRAAIGSVVLEWARLEDQVSLNSASLILGEPIIPAWLMTHGATLGYLLPRVRAYLTLVLSTENRDKFLPMFDQLNQRISDAQLKRNRIVHCAWQQAGPRLLTTTPLRLRGKVFGFEQFTMSRSEILALAEEARKLRDDVANLLIWAERARDDQNLE